jgi:hypothetical protein
MTTKKAKLMAFKCNIPFSGKVIIDDNILEEISRFSYLGSDKRNTLYMDLTI